MTTEEAINMYGTRSVFASKNDTLMSICWQLYKSYDTRLLRSLCLMNNLQDWISLEPGREILYLPSGNMLEIEEL